jgi:hypothetical protein
MIQNIKIILKSVLPLNVYKFLTQVYNQLCWLVDVRGSKSRKMFLELKDKHKGERCFIIGNGPSLNDMDMSLLKNEITIGMNRIYLLFPKLGFSTNYYVAVNGLVVEQCAREIEEVDSIKFVSWLTRRYVKPESDCFYVHDPYGGHRIKFSKNPLSKTYFDSTVTFVSIQLAYWMGFDEVILIGVDHNFITKGENDKRVTSKGDDLNHFDPSYFGKGFRWQLPNLDRSEISYNLSKSEFEKADRKILDATVGGKLDIFDKINYKDLFNR